MAGEVPLRSALCSDEGENEVQTRCARGANEVQPQFNLNATSIAPRLHLDCTSISPRLKPQINLAGASKKPSKRPRLHLTETSTGPHRNLANASRFSRPVSPPLLQRHPGKMDVSAREWARGCFLKWRSGPLCLPGQNRTSARSLCAAVHH